MLSRSVDGINIANKSGDTETLQLPHDAMGIGLTPCPPNFNVVVKASRAPLAFAMIYVIGEGCALSLQH